MGENLKVSVILDGTSKQDAASELPIRAVDGIVAFGDTVQLDEDTLYQQQRILP